MNRYLLKSNQSQVTLSYDNKKLKLIESDPNISELHLTFIVARGLLLEDNIDNVKETQVKVFKLDVTFEEFWNKYAYKKDMQNAKKEWNKLSDEDKLNAYQGIKQFKYKNGNYGQPALPYAERYLKYKRWEDED